MKRKPYGGISNIPQYLADQYGEKGVLVDRGSYLDMNPTSMEVISGRKTRNCSVVAVTRVLDYYRKSKKIVGIPEEISDTYKAVEEIAISYGYNDKIGTIPFFISGIAREAFAKYGIKAKCKGVYIWSFEKQVVKEISEGRPVILNIARGYYKDHTVVVAGYCIWRIGKKNYPMLRVIDGWKSGYHYIDYEAFAKDITQSIFGSFNTIVLK
ncbi:C39 family peptidase [Butyrivibrio sp. YAB3001]|uniref:C39 family peptidase n=1 Tax=Butyrivibrio sp. YAB3001 TaxID=1520812 RepID=UPI0008F65AF1|nr:C39 family peptidase [Butyrivibrio sp. YAB3001]SFD01283.1 Peptidase_C39 like family protein [Butyrivibrio sp. YAB3001]